jgi:hypothetical protein
VKFYNNKVPSYGGGISCMNCPSTVEITNSDIYDNEAGIKGGGISFMGNSSAVIEQCSIQSCTAQMGGGGIWVDATGCTPSPEPLISENYISSNYTYGEDDASLNDLGNGGGIGISNSNVIIEGNYIYYNYSVAGSYSESGYGGGLYVLSSDNPVLEYNHIGNNTAESGGGMAINNSDVLFKSNVIHFNFSSMDGGGIYLYNDADGAFINHSITDNNSNNDGGGCYSNDCEPSFINCTIANNNSSGEGDGVYMYQGYNYIFRNTIIYHNGSGDGLSINGADPIASSNNYNSCDIENFAGSPPYSNNNIKVDPYFVDYSNGDYRISFDDGSDCIGGGNNSYVSGISYDIRGDGYNRIVGSNVDIGAYEYENPTPSYKISSKDTGSSINSESVTDIFIFPNPAKQNLSMHIVSNYEDIIDIRMVNSIGQTVYESKFMINKGDNIFPIDRNNLVSGIYYLKVSSGFTNYNTKTLIFK